MVVEQMQNELSALGYKGKHNLSSINDKMLHRWANALWASLHSSFLRNDYVVNVFCLRHFR